METKRILIIIFSLVLFKNANAQSDAAVRLESNKYYISYIKDYIEAMKVNTDTVSVLSLLDRMSALADEVSAELDKIVVDSEPEAENYLTEEYNYQDSSENTYTWPDYNDNNGGYNNPNNMDFGMGKLNPFRSRSNTNLILQFGLNGMTQNELPPLAVTPEINTGRSWYFEIGLARKLKIGGKSSQSAFTYGLSYLSNRFRFNNDVRLFQFENRPVFAVETGLRNDPVLSLGYITVPVGFKFRFSDSFRLDIGAYAGYRVRAVQHISRKFENETYHTTISGAWRLNDWMYGLSGGVGIGPFNIIAKYNLSNLFRANPNYDFNVFMLGTSLSLF